MTDLAIGLVTSGQGTMLRWIIEACRAGAVAGDVVAVASNRKCRALEVADQEDVGAIKKFEESTYNSIAARDAAIADFLRSAGVSLVVVAGYTQRLDRALFDVFPDRVISMYPSMLPAFAELDEAIGPALDYGVKQLGMTFHFHAPGSLSGGPIIAQEVIAVDIDDTVESVIPRISVVEKRMLFEILAAFADSRITRVGDKVRYRR